MIDVMEEKNKKSSFCMKDTIRTHDVMGHQTSFFWNLLGYVLIVTKIIPTLEHVAGSYM